MSSRQKKRRKSPGIIKSTYSLKNHFFKFGDLYAAAATAILFIAHLFSTTDYFLGSGTDMVSMEYPLQAFGASWLREGILPLWNPFIFGGIPFQAGVHSCLYPSSWLGVLFSTETAIKISIASHLVLATAGGSFLARNQVRHPLAAYMAGIITGLSAFTVSHLYAGHLTLVATYAYLPWTIGMMHRAINKNKHWVLPGAFFCGLMLICGHYQMVFIGMLGGTLFLFSGAIAKAVTLPGSFIGKLRFPAVSGGLIILILLWGSLLAMVQILPQIQALSLSQRAQGGTEFAASFSSAPDNLLTFFLPNLFGNKVDLPFIGSWSYWESLGYLGLIPLMLITLALLTQPLKKTIPLIIPISIGVLFSLGNHTTVFNWFVTLVPGSDLFRAAGRYTLLVTLFGGLLAAQGFDNWLCMGADNNKSKWAARIVGVLFLLGTLWVGYFFYTIEPPEFGHWISSFDLSDKLSSTKLEALQTALASSVSQTSLKMALIYSIAGVFIAAATFRRFNKPEDSTNQTSRNANIAKGKSGKPMGDSKTKRLLGKETAIRTLLGIFLIMLLSADLYHFGNKFLKTGSPSLFGWPKAISQELQTQPGERVIVSPKLHQPNFSAAVGVGTPGGYDIFLDKRYAHYLNIAKRRNPTRFLSYVTIRRNNQLISHLGAKYLLTQSPLYRGANRQVRGFNDFSLQQKTEDYFLYQTPNPTPRAFMVHNVQTVWPSKQFNQFDPSKQRKIIQKLADPSFNILQTAMVETTDKTQLQFKTPSISNSDIVTITQYTPNQVTIDVTAASDGLLVLSDTVHPGWRATVDDKPSAIYPTNSIMRGVVVSKGKHTVKMTFEPHWFTKGAWISTLFALFTLMCAFWLKVKNNPSYPKNQRKKPQKAKHLSLRCI